MHFVQFRHMLDIASYNVTILQALLCLRLHAKLAYHVPLDNILLFSSTFEIKFLLQFFKKDCSR